MIAVDTHAHIFETGLELVPNRRYAPTYNATAEDYLAQLDANGVRCGVLVQPSFLGVNNDYMIQALRRHRTRLRGIAVVDPDIAPDILDKMNEDGVVGIRLNLLRLPIPNFNEGAWQKFFAHLRRLDWQVEFVRESRDLPLIIDPLLDAGVNVVVDHFGHPVQAGADDAGFQHLLAKAKSRRVWVKLSGGYRNWPNAPDGAVARQCAALLLQHFGPERLMWGSDWPHTQNESKVTFGATRGYLDSWVPDEQARRIILQDTPVRLFRFNISAAA